MKSSVYRNLDKPFQIFGFNILELTILCFSLVGGGEMTDALGIPRIWSFLFTVILGLGMVWIRQALGDFFGRRLVRFWGLPKELYPQIIILRRKI